MPSEQSQGSPKFASDIYSLGIMAIFALTGIDPNNIRKNPQTEEIIWRDENQVSDDLGNFIDQMVKYNFRDRYHSAIEAKEALQKIKVPPTDILEAPILSPSKPQLSVAQKIVVATTLLLTLGGGYYYFNRLQEPSVLFLTYENSDYGIEVDYPDNWVLEKIEDPFGTVVRFFPKNSQGESVPVLVTIEVENIESNISLDEYTTSAISKITKYLPEAKIISSQPIKLGTKAAHRVIYTGKNSGMAFTSKYLQVWLLEENRAYIY